LQRCGIDEVVVLHFNDRFAAMPPQAFIDDVLRDGLRAKYVLVGDDFNFGAKRAGNYAMLDAAGPAAGFDVARMLSYEVHGHRVSSSAVRDALARGDMAQAEALLGRPYSISGHVLHGRKLGRDLGFRTLNLRFTHARPAAQGIFAVRVQGLGNRALPGVASLGVRPSVEDAGRVLLEVHCLQWPEELGADGGYGRLVRVELLHKIHDEVKYPSLQALQQGIERDTAQAVAWHARAAA
jgi:riboflavin kinase/FMN adenylyltransferase